MSGEDKVKPRTHNFKREKVIGTGGGNRNFLHVTSRRKERDFLARGDN